MRLTHLLACAFLVIAPLSADGPETPSVANDVRVVSALELARTWLEAQRAYDQIPGRLGGHRRRSTGALERRVRTS